MVLSVPPQRQAAFRRRLVESLQAIGREFGSKSRADARPLALTFVLAPALASSHTPSEGAQPLASAKRRPRARRSY